MPSQICNWPKTSKVALFAIRKTFPLIFLCSKLIFHFYKSIQKMKKQMTLIHKEISHTFGIFPRKPSNTLIIYTKKNHIYQMRHNNIFFILIKSKSLLSFPLFSSSIFIFLFFNILLHYYQSKLILIYISCQ